MEKKDLNALDFSDLKTNSQYQIKSLIASNSEKYPLEKYFSFNHPVTFDGIIFGICSKGGAKIKINFKEHSVEKNTILTLMPGHIFDCIELSEDFFIEFLAFSDKFVLEMPFPRDIQILKTIALNPVLQVQEKYMHNLLHYHSFIIETFEARKKSPYLDEILRGLLYALVMELATLYQQDTPNYPKKNNSRYKEITEQFFIILFEHYKEERKTSYYANKLCITPKHLSAVLKEVTGHTINAWIEMAVVIGAKSLLKSTSYTILQISEELNFPTASYFGRFFKRLTGMTPIEYRNS